MNMMSLDWNNSDNLQLNSWMGLTSSVFFYLIFLKRQMWHNYCVQLHSIYIYIYISMTSCKTPFLTYIYLCVCFFNGPRWMLSQIQIHQHQMALMTLWLWMMNPYQKKLELMRISPPESHLMFGGILLSYKIVKSQNANIVRSNSMLRGGMGPHPCGIIC